MYLTWDEKKAKTNLKKHQVRFAEAATCFSDPNGVLNYDKDHSDLEDRWQLIATSVKGRVLFVVFFEMQDDQVKLISARKAEKHEVKQYGS